MSAFPPIVHDDGTITARIVPSNWRCFNISPDTYQLFTGDSWLDRTQDHLAEEYGTDDYGAYEWNYDHPAIVRALSDELANWIFSALHDEIPSLGSYDRVHVVDSWSPTYYNFTSDGLEVELTFDLKELIAATPDFDLDAWVREYYESVDGFASWVPGRIRNRDWRAQYETELRIESYLAAHATEDEWKEWVWESEDEVYDNHVTVEFRGLVNQ